MHKHTVDQLKAGAEDAARTQQTIDEARQIVRQTIGCVTSQVGLTAATIAMGDALAALLALQPDEDLRKTLSARISAQLMQTAFRGGPG
jgi:hypothetical protein